MESREAKKSPAKPTRRSEDFAQLRKRQVCVWDNSPVVCRYKWEGLLQGSKGQQGPARSQRANTGQHGPNELLSACVCVCVAVTWRQIHR